MCDSKIIFYDLASNKPEFPLSPNTWKTRFTLNYKGIPFKTEWIEFPEIAIICKEKGIPPTGTDSDGNPRYTVPSIWDPSTKTGVSDSYRIAEYLDKTYPDTPPVLFNGIEEYDQVMNPLLGAPRLISLFPFVASFLYGTLNPVSQEYRRKADPSFGRDLAEVFPTSKEREEAWEGVKKSFDILDGLLEKKGGPFSRGEQISFVEFSLGGYLFTTRSLWGEDSEYWRNMETWNDGRWGKLVKKLDECAVPAASTK